MVSNGEFQMIGEGHLVKKEEAADGRRTDLLLVEMSCISHHLCRISMRRRKGAEGRKRSINLYPEFFCFLEQNRAQ